MSDDSIKPPVATSTPETIGHLADKKIPVEISTRFLEHFSEQLYSSPQKAFEELISNGWDAGAKNVDIHIPEDLEGPTAAMCIFDDGSSMDEQGLRDLWHIAFSPKQAAKVQHGRSVIGKFGIGKLATYVLAKKLTYICKASDGIIRRVTMNYGELDKQKGTISDRLINSLELELYTVTETELSAALDGIPNGSSIKKAISSGINVKREDSIDDFCWEKSGFVAPKPGTWTLVVLSDLKTTGKGIKLGVLRRMLESALPMNSEMNIILNDAVLQSSKNDTPILHEWTIGKDIDIGQIEIDEDEVEIDEDDPESADGTKKNAVRSVKISMHGGENPHAMIDGVGKVTGKVRLYSERISGGKSEKRGSSNGFFVNVLGRVVNQNDPSFGEKNLSHAAWARFRMTVRADFLNNSITTNREQFVQKTELKIFRAFLRKSFNFARTHYDSDQNAGMPDGGDVLVKSLGVLSLSPLRNVVSDALKSKDPVPGILDDSGITDRSAKLKDWRAATSDNIGAALKEIKFESFDDDSFVKYRMLDNTIVVNRDHPFVLEHSKTKAEKELVRTMAMVHLLTDAYSMDIGVDLEALKEIRSYRDRLMRFKAFQQRKSGIFIAKLLLDTQHVSEQSKQLEAAVSAAIDYLGFQVTDLANPGEPEGIAYAHPLPTKSLPTIENPNPPLYSFTFDAKSSKHDSAATNNINLAGVVEHRERYHADHALVIAPGYSGDAIVTRCEQQKVTPMTAHDLGRLLEYTVEYGAIPLVKLREVFYIYDFAEVTKWVASLEDWFKSQRPLTLDIFLKALESLKGKVPDALSAGIIALRCRETLGAITVKDQDVIDLVRGLSILIPDLVGLGEGKQIVINASAERVAQAVHSQLEKLRG